MMLLDVELKRFLDHSSLLICLMFKNKWDLQIVDFSAFATNLAFEKISKFEFEQGSLRPHLKACSEEKYIHIFP